MEAYLDSLITREDQSVFDIIVGDSCDLPQWILNDDSFEIRRYEMDDVSGVSLIHTCADVVSRYIKDYNVGEIRQITQPRWHALE